MQILDFAPPPPSPEKSMVCLFGTRPATVYSGGGAGSASHADISDHSSARAAGSSLRPLRSFRFVARSKARSASSCPSRIGAAAANLITGVSNPGGAAGFYRYQGKLNNSSLYYGDWVWPTGTGASTGSCSGWPWR